MEVGTSGPKGQVFKLRVSAGSPNNPCPFLPAGPENRHVLPQNEARCQPDSVHPEQGETEGEPVSKEPGGGIQRAQHSSHGLFLSQQR